MSIDIGRIKAVIAQMSLDEKMQFLGCGLKLLTAHSDKYKVFSLKLPEEFLCYKPTLSALGCTFNRELATNYGQMCRILSQKNRLLVDGVINLGVVRNPMADGAEHMLSEDPLVVSELAKGFIRGAGSVVGTNILSGEGAFAVRNMDERAKREIYTLPLELVKEELAGVCIPSGTLNGEPVCTSKSFGKIVREFMGINAPIFSEAGAVINKCKTLNIYENFEVAQCVKGKYDVLKDVENGNLDEKRVDRCLERIISLVANRYESLKKKDDIKKTDFDEEISSQSVVMLKNDGILPLKVKQNIAINGVIEKLEADIFGHGLGGVVSLKAADTVVVFAKGRGGKLEEKAEKSLLKASDDGKKTILVILSPRPVETKIMLTANAVLFVPHVYMATFDALAKILTGKVNPSGKLNVSWTFNKTDYLAFKNSDYAEWGMCCYESVFNGYRYFNSFNKDVQFPFGYGLSYAEFSYSNIALEACDDFLDLEFTVKNVGNVSGDTVCFVFGSSGSKAIYGLKSRLIGFARVSLDASENTRVKIKIPYKNLSVFDANTDRWVMPGGMLKVSVGGNALHLPLKNSVKLPFSSRKKIGLNKKTLPSYFENDFKPTKKEIQTLLGVCEMQEALKLYTAPPKSSTLYKKAAKRIKSALKENVAVNLTGFSEFGLLKILKSDI